MLLKKCCSQDEIRSLHQEAFEIACFNCGARKGNKQEACEEMSC